MTNRLMMHFSEHILVVKQCMTVLNTAKLHTCSQVCTEDSMELHRCSQVCIECSRSYAGV